MEIEDNHKKIQTQIVVSDSVILSYKEGTGKY